MFKRLTDATYFLARQSLQLRKERGVVYSFLKRPTASLASNLGGHQAFAVCQSQLCVKNWKRSNQNIWRKISWNHGVPKNRLNKHLTKTQEKHRKRYVNYVFLYKWKYPRKFKLNISPKGKKLRWETFLKMRHNQDIPLLNGYVTLKLNFCQRHCNSLS